MDATTVLDRILELTVLLGDDMDAALGALGLTRSRTHLLWVLQQTGPCTQRVLAEALGVTARNVTGLVDGLEETGFIERRPHPTDRRATLVSLTPHGARVMTRMAQDHQELAGFLLDGLSARDVTTFSRTLAHVVDRLRDRLSQERPRD